MIRNNINISDVFNIPHNNDRSTSSAREFPLNSISRVNNLAIIKPTNIFQPNARLHVSYL